MKKMLIQLLTIAVLSVLLTGCGSAQNINSKNKQNNAVDNVLQQGVEKQSGKAAETESQGDTEAKERNPKLYIKDNKYDEKVDIDTTTMNSSMVYSTIYQLMYNPKEYEGKVIAIKGNYYSVWYEPTQSYYHYAVVSDATACCASGLEFVWDDGSHVFPQDYPLEDDEIYVTGVFQTYTENGDLYCRLNDATLYMVK